MKKVFVLALALVLLSVCIVQAQEKSKKAEVPAAAKAAFEAKYPKAEKVNWGIEKPGELEAEFILNGVESSAVFNTKGDFLESEAEIKEVELPQSVKAAIAKDFAAYKLDEIEKSTDAKGVVAYEMELSKGKEKYEVSFDAGGKLLKKNLEKKEGKDKD